MGVVEDSMEFRSIGSSPRLSKKLLARMLPRISLDLSVEGSVGDSLQVLHTVCDGRCDTGV